MLAQSWCYFPFLDRVSRVGLQQLLHEPHPVCVLLTEDKVDIGHQHLLQTYSMPSLAQFILRIVLFLSGAVFCSFYPAQQHQRRSIRQQDTGTAAMPSTLLPMVCLWLSQVSRFAYTKYPSKPRHLAHSFHFRILRLHVVLSMYCFLYFSDILVSSKQSSEKPHVHYNNELY